MNFEEIKTNIARLEHTLTGGHFAPAYYRQCRKQIETYRARLEELEADEDADLFENRAALPEAVLDVLDRLGDREACADLCRELEKELEPLGYGFEWGLCCTPHSLHALPPATGAKVLPFRSICRGLFEAVKVETGAAQVVKKHVPGLGFVLYAYDTAGAMIAKAAKTGDFFELMPRIV